jgi:pimeloyl-ACP methyl ester carboxylesterase
MKIRFARPTCLIAAIATFVACFALGQSQPTSAHEGFVDVPGAKIFYKDSGGLGTPVIFLHANTGSAEVWEHQIPAFTRAGYRFIAYDRRGFGRTVADASGPASTGADDLLALVDHLKIDKFHVLGTAGGGFIAVDFAIAYPQRLRSFTLVASTSGIQDPDYAEALRRMRPEGFTKMPNSFLELSPSYRFENPEGAARWSEFEAKNRAPEAVRGPTQPTKNRVTLAMLEGIKVPTLVIAGDADLYAPPALMRRIADRIKGSQFVAIPDAGHSVWWEQPEQFNRTVLTFVAKH